MAVTVGMVHLGCAKNQVDGELLLAALAASGFEIVEDPACADVAIVNTCGFIESAKKESIDEILELARCKAEGRVKRLVVTGCLAERYREEIHRELPEVDAVLGIGANGEAPRLLRQMLEDGFVESFPEKGRLPLCGARRLSTPPWTAYLKIAEGCDNRCAFCAIPMIRGRYRSRPVEEIEEEARTLVADGVKELVLIAQDTTRYGGDLYGGYSLAALMERLCRIEGLRWLRVLYCYPDAITDELIAVMAREEKIVKYIDLPLQHCSQTVLRRMRRGGDRASLHSLLEKLRAQIPGVTLRTTVMAGFPGETEEDFEQLAAFVKAERFDRLGCFAYSQEEGTPAAALPDQLDEEEKRRRAEIITELQGRIMEEKGRDCLGRTLEVLVEGFDAFSGCWYGRSAMDAPDIDGKVYFTAEEAVEPGSFCAVNIEDCIDCDLYGWRAPEEGDLL